MPDLLRIAALATAGLGFLLMTWVQKPGSRGISGAAWEDWNQGMFGLAALALGVSLLPRWRSSVGPGLLYFLVGVAMTIHLFLATQEIDRINTMGVYSAAPFERRSGVFVAWVAAGLHALAGFSLLRHRPPRAG